MANQQPKRRFRLFLMLAASFGLFIMFWRWFERSQIYFPTRDVGMLPVELGRSCEDFFLRSEDGVKLQAWFFPAAATSPRARFAVLFCHGNGGNITHRGETYRAILQTGASLLAFDYRGYGRSEGKPGEAGTYADARAALGWLGQKGFPPGRIVLWGESLGGGIATEIAAHEPVAGLVLQSCFTSIPDIGAEIFPWLPVRWLARIRYDTRAKLPQVHCPLLVMHSRADEIIPFHHGERNFAAANEPKLFCELTGGHNDALETARQRYADGAEKFLQLVEAQAATP